MYIDFEKNMYIDFVIHLNIHYVQIHSKSYISKKARMTYTFKRREYNSTFEISQTFSNRLTYFIGKNISTYVSIYVYYKNIFYN
jgi:hypothetical protein